MAGLDELKDKLTIKIPSNAKTYVKGNDKGGFLKRKEHLNEIELLWLCDEKDENKVVSDKAIVEELQPNQNLKRLWVSGYRDVEKPSWAVDDKLQTSLPNLVELEFYGCEGLDDLPMLGGFRFLKKLRVKNLAKLEYLEKGSSGSYGEGEAISGEGSFPSLEELWLEDLPKLKGWWRDRHRDDDDRSDICISFPHLSFLWVSRCPLLATVPLCPTLETLYWTGFDERLKIMKIKSGRNGGSGAEDGDEQV